MCEIFEHLKLTKTSEVQKLRRNVAQDNRATHVETAESEQDEVLMQCALNFAKKHSMHGPEEHTMMSVVNILMFVFTVGSIMFVRTVVGGLLCETNADGRTYLAVQGDIECTKNGDAFVDPIPPDEPDVVRHQA